MERKSYENGPYSRREISDIPGIIDGSTLEELFWTYFEKLTLHSYVEDYHCHKLTNNARQKVIVKLSKRKGIYRVLKAKPSLKNVYLTGTGLPPDTPIFVNQTLWRYAKFLCSNGRYLG